MFREFIRLVKSWRPDWIVFENVKGIGETENGNFLELILERFRAQGYTVSEGTLNAVEFGVPQRRERLFVIGSRHGVKIPFSKFKKSRPLAVAQALADLPDLGNGSDIDLLPYKSLPISAYVRKLRNGGTMVSGNLVTRNADFVLKRYKHVAQGGNWEDIPKKLMANCFTRIESICETAYMQVVHYLKRISFPAKPVIYTGPLCGYFDFLWPLLKELKNLSFMPKGPIFLLLDDADNLSYTQTRILNSWVSARTSNTISLKISTQLSYKSFQTVAGHPAPQHEPRQPAPTSEVGVQVGGKCWGRGVNRCGAPGWIFSARQVQTLNVCPP